MKKHFRKLVSSAAAVAAVLGMCLFPAQMPGLGIESSAAGINTALTMGDGYTSLRMTVSDGSHRIYYTLDAGTEDTKTKEYNGGKLKFTSPKTIIITEKDTDGKTVYTKDFRIDVRLSVPSFTLKDNLDGTASIWLTSPDEGVSIIYNTGGKKNYTYKKGFKVKAGKTVTVHCEREGYKNSYDVVINTGDYITENSYTDYINKALSETNAARAELGLPALKLDKTLCRACGIRAKEIAKDYSIIHTRAETGEPWYTVLDETGFAYSHAAENIQYLDGRGVAPVYAVEKWIDSPVHYENIISTENDRVGFAFVQNSGKCYWVQIFGKKL